MKAKLLLKIKTSNFRIKPSALTLIPFTSFPKFGELQVTSRNRQMAIGKCLHTYMAWYEYPCKGIRIFPKKMMVQLKQLRITFNRELTSSKNCLVYCARKTYWQCKNRNFTTHYFICRQTIFQQNTRWKYNTLGKNQIRYNFY